MRVTLRLEGIGSAEGRLKVAEIGTQAFRIGRSPEADWTLDDPSNRVSGIHLELREAGGALVVTDLSSGGTAVDSPGARLQRGQPAPLPARATLILPSGTIEVLAEAATAPSPGTAPPSFASPSFDPPPAAPPSPSASSPAMPSSGAAAPVPPPSMPPAARPSRDETDDADVFGLRGRQAARAPQQDDPFAPLMPRETQPQRPVTAPGAGSPSPSLPSLGAPGVPAPRRGGLPSLGETDPGSASGPPRASARSFDDLLSGGAAAAPAQPSGFAPSRPAPPADAAPSQPAPLPLDPRPQDGAAPPPPAVPPPTRAAEGAAAPAGAPAQAADVAPEALDALFRGLGLDPAQMTPAQQAAAAESVGRVFFALADAMRRLLDGRRHVKRELGVAGTEIEFGANPLKFAPSPQAAVEGLLRPLSAGYLTGEPAVADALDAMQGHQLALVGAIRSAIRIGLEAFDPAELERKMEKRGLSQVVPALRRAELWERFCEDYARFAEQADTDIRTVIGRELDALYAGGGQPGSGRGGARTSRGGER